MSPYKPKTFLRICTACGSERYTMDTRQYSGLCKPCALVRYRANRAAAILRRPLHFLPGELFAEETMCSFWEKVDMETACPCHPWDERCWQWIGGTSEGYGVFYIKEPYQTTYHVRAHRFLFQAEHRRLLSDDIDVLHKPPCLLRNCVRHIYAGTAKQNMADTRAMAHMAVGERLPQAILTEDIVCAIRADYAAGMRLYLLVKKYGYGRGTIAHVIHRRTWQHIP